ncbi:MAG: rhomboid family intramembrane serine protease [Acidobacteriota bacterium]|nr:rhomboid family intramembrane serine protease [Acidobacteriota bacterium]
MPRSSPITMTLPPFAGVVRRLVLANVAVFFALAVVGLIAPKVAGVLTLNMMLEPWAVAHGRVWELVTYSFVQNGLLDILFGMLTLWFCGSMLEGAYGGRWLGELYFSSVVGGAALASALAFTGQLRLSPKLVGAGAWAGIFGLLMGIAMRFGEQEFLLWFVVRVRAKYMVAIYILIALAVLLLQANAFAALLELAGASCGYLYVRFAPRRGLGFSWSEQVYGARNAWYRAKRRRAAKKFEVYMGKQGREVRFDDEGRYVDPDTVRKENGAARRDPNDRRWMN